jgi:Flp pilus assembly CpaE family ATPase
MMGEGEIRCQRGRIFAVVAPTGGNGGTFVSLNLAAQLAKSVSGKGAFIDMACGLSKVPLVLHHEPESTIEDACGRLHRSDRSSLLGMFHRDDSGLQLLYGPSDQPSDNFLTSEVVRRLAVLSRMAAASTVLRIGSTIRQPQVDAMRLADRVVMVVRPDVPSLDRASATMDRLGGYGVPAERIVVAINSWGEYGLATKAHIEETLHWKGPHYLSYDPGRVNRCVNEGVLLQNRYPRCRLAKELGKLGKQLMA